MNYRETIQYIESLSPTTQSPCLERIAAFMQEAGNFQNDFASIHVGGTNGKGSTVAILDSVLRSGGLKVGRFTGPHLLRWNERFHVDGSAISDSKFAELATSIRKRSEDFGQRHREFGPLTWFEFLTVLAFTYFADEKVDVAVIEVGLGGRWDATNVLSSPAVTAITSIDLDHTHILGSTVKDIATEKAGIIKPGIPLITAVSGQALQPIFEIARRAGSPMVHCLPPDTMHVLGPSEAFNFSGGNDPLSLLKARQHLKLSGAHQQANALVACGALSASGLAAMMKRPLHQAAIDGFGSVYWPGRFQYIPELNLIFDGAHNPAGARALRQTLDESFPGQKMIFVLGFFENKDVEAMVRSLLRPGDRVMASEADCRRATYPKSQITQLANCLGNPGETFPDIKAAISAALKGKRDNEIVVATGSLATVREGMLKLGWQTVEDGQIVTAPHLPVAVGV